MDTARDAPAAIPCHYRRVKLFVVIAVFLVALYLLVDRLTEGPTPTTFRGMVERDQFEVRGPAGFYRYTVDPRETSFTGVAVQTNPRLGFDDAGIEARLIWFDEDTAVNFMETYGPTESCPADFFNTHSRQRLLIARDEIVESTIQEWDLPDFQQTVHWERFEVNGHCVVGFEQGEVDGAPAAVIPGVLENCFTMVVTDISRSSGAMVY